MSLKIILFLAISFVSYITCQVYKNTKPIATTEKKYIIPFESIRLNDITRVGGKNASLGQMIGELSAYGILVPTGFAITAEAYWYFLQHNNLMARIKNILATLTDYTNLEQLKTVGSAIRNHIMQAHMPDDLEQEIIRSYYELSQYYAHDDVDVAVRSSGTAEDLPDASFAGQQETYLNIRGSKAIIEYCKQCFASLFTDRAIMYRTEKGYNHFDVALSIGIQKMVRSDLACSGVAFSLDTESGFSDAITISASYGLGEAIVQGEVNPDEYVVHKPTLQQGFSPIIKKYRGQKQIKMIYSHDKHESVRIVPVAQYDQEQFALSDEDILALSKAVLTIEKHYSTLKNGWCPMDIEWAKDGIDEKLYIVQARPETIHSNKQHNLNTLTTYKLNNPHNIAPCATGQSVGQKIVSGTARILLSLDDINQIQEGEILVTYATNPDWVPAMKKAVGIITEQGGRTCHAAIVSRELNIAAIVGAQDVTKIIKNGQPITMDCSTGKVGYIYPDILQYESKSYQLKNIPTPPAHIMLNLADPDRAFTLSFLPVSGVGLARLEFLINNTIKIHPMALLHPEKIDQKTQKTVDAITSAYPDKPTFFVDSLAQGIATIAAAFYPKPVIVRLSDFKSNEYRNLIGGQYFEFDEENPMIGFRGASRYYHERYQEAFALECAALKKVRDTMGLTNVKAMIPFVRTVDEGKKVIHEMEKHGLKQKENGLEIIMMCEIPSNVILIDEFSTIFDGFSIGSNDLTQLTLGVDRDSGILTSTFDERDAAVQKMLELAVAGAVRNKKYSGICGQAPSDYPEIAERLIQLGIGSLSLNPDSVIPFLMRYAQGDL